MNTDSPDIHFERGMLLYQQDRHALAEAELRLSLAADPEHAPAHAVLALCLAEQGKVEPAADEAEQAIRLDPAYAFAHYARALVFTKDERNAEAEQAVREALRIDPTSPAFYALLASIQLDRRNPISAIEAAEQGLAYDPTHAGCSALRTLALLRLGRTDDASSETAAALRRDPQDSLAHAGRGWALLHEKKPAEALTHFREALRLDPTNEYARDGLVAALKARYWVYRQMLGFFLWMSRLSTGAQIGVIIGILVFQRSLVAAGQNDPALRPFTAPILYALFGFIMLCWLADPLFTLLLRLNRFGRLVLNSDEIRQSNWIGGALAAGLCGAVVWIVTPYPFREFGAIWTIGALLSLIPLAATFRCASGWRSRFMACYTLGIVIAIAVSLTYLVIASEQSTGPAARDWADRSLAWFQGAVIASFLGGFVANGLILSKR